MTTKNFDYNTQSLLLPITAETLQFQSHKTGEVFPANDNDTLLYSEGIKGIDIRSKYKQTLRMTAHEPSNPKIIVDDGCVGCGRTIVSFQRLGENKKVIYVCRCGRSWS